jgi:hypothetical protein
MWYFLSCIVCGIQPKISSWKLANFRFALESDFQRTSSEFNCLKLLGHFLFHKGWWHGAPSHRTIEQRYKFTQKWIPLQACPTAQSQVHWKQQWEQLNHLRPTEDRVRSETVQLRDGRMISKMANKIEYFFLHAQLLWKHRAAWVVRDSMTCFRNSLFSGVQSLSIMGRRTLPLKRPRAPHSNNTEKQLYLM